MGAVPQLWYVDQQYNQAIVNREPDYGIDGKDGDVVKNEFMINIDDIKIDSVQNRLQLNGMIIGKETKERLWGVNFEVVSPQKKLIRDGESSVFKGRFILESNFFENDLIKVSQVGYRTLSIDLSKIIGQLKR